MNSLKFTCMAAYAQNVLGISPYTAHKDAKVGYMLKCVVEWFLEPSYWMHREQCDVLIKFINQIVTSICPRSHEVVDQQKQCLPIACSAQ